MTTVMTDRAAPSPRADARSAALAERLEQGALALASFAGTLSDAEWSMPCSFSDRRTLGVIVHHVASMYPLEIQVAQLIAAGKPVTDVTWEVVAEINAGHAKENAGVTKQAALDLLTRNSAAAAAAIRAFSDADLAEAVPNSMYGGAPLTCQFFLEDHAVRHSYHHLAKIRKTLGR